MCALTRLVVVKLICRYLAAKLIKCFFHGSEQTEKFRIFGESLALIRQQPERVCLKRPLTGIYETFILLLIALLGSYPMAMVSAELPDSSHSVEVMNLRKARQVGRDSSRFLRPTQELIAEKVVSERPEADVEAYEQSVQSILIKSCLDCHGPEESQGRLRIDQLDPDLLAGKDVAQWREIYNAISHQEMPPQDDPEYAMSEESRSHIIEWLSGELAKASIVQRNEQSSSSFRRLTKYEYNYALQDLLGLPLFVANELPPETNSEEGFKNSSSLLQMSAMQFESYREIGLEALSRAVVGEVQPERVRYVVHMQDTMEKFAAASPDKVFQADSDDADNQKRRSHLWNQATQSGIQFSNGSWKPVTDTAHGVFEHSTDVFLSLPRSAELKMNLDRFLPDDGVMRVRILASRSSMKENEFAALRLAFSAHTSNNANFMNQISQSDVPVTASPDHPEWVHFDIQLQDIQRNPFRHLETTFPRRDEFLHIRNIANTNGDKNSFQVRIHAIEIEAPYYDQWPPKTHTSIFFESPNRSNERVYAAEVLKRFLMRAWGGPVSDGELTSFVDLFLRYRSDFPRFEDAMVEVLATALASPRFLYLVQQRSSSKSDQIDEQSLASRIASFLWASDPDERLLKLAGEGKLREPNILDDEITRMLADSKSKRLSKHFVSQWLGLDGLDATTHIKDADLLVSMRDEPIALFQETLSKNSSVIDLIHADYVMVNEKLARLYGIRDVFGPHFRRIEISENHHRGGVLTCAGVLAMNSNGRDSNPLQRGVWMLERVLHDPPPPPPPNVPEVDLTDPKILEMTLKERLADHRDQAACKSCHSRIDPWGIAFEQYDASGAFRNQIAGQTVDASSKLFNGQKLDGIDGLKRYLLSERQDQFSEAIVHKLVSYALGRHLTFADHSDIEGIASELRRENDGLESLVRIIIHSDLFSRID